MVLTMSNCNDETVKNPKNIILFIGDGMGYNHVDAASYYQYGERGKQVYEQFPVKLGMSTHQVNGVKYCSDSAWVNFKFVKKKPTDSGAAGTAMATGVKTYNGAIAVDSSKNRLETVVETAEKTGRATGIVTTVPLSHATPAAFAAHNEKRYHYNEIAREMILESAVDVIMGAGHPFYNPDGSLIEGAKKRVIGKKELWDMENDGAGSDEENKNKKANYKYVGSKETWELLVSGKAGADADGDGDADPWSFIEDRELFQKYMTGDTPKRVMGIYKNSVTTQIERNMKGDTGIPYSVPLLETIPTLTEMTIAAVNILDEDPEGFFLMVEGGAIDWASHANTLNRMIEEMVDFNESVDAVCEWVETYSNWDETLLIVTADHETGYLLGPGSNSEAEPESWLPLKNNGKGMMPGVEWYSTHHTNSLIPFYAKGAG
ncbi:MAG: alkaline phosphatase, partial [Candidatus Marinimicrobia bacterium]|nr:alkaline phosphatase [Candidatus Neomarinimicrobiota bacterium]